MNIGTRTIPLTRAYGRDHIERITLCLNKPVDGKTDYDLEAKYLYRTLIENLPGGIIDRLTGLLQATDGVYPRKPI